LLEGANTMSDEMHEGTTEQTIVLMASKSLMFVKTDYVFFIHVAYRLEWRCMVDKKPL
jgi:predicted regulator of Ras-like GTPase activity (Roadblock/LC7/MglB family)